MVGVVDYHVSPRSAQANLARRSERDDDRVMTERDDSGKAPWPPPFPAATTLPSGSPTLQSGAPPPAGTPPADANDPMKALLDARAAQPHVHVPSGGGSGSGKALMIVAMVLLAIFAGIWVMRVRQQREAERERQQFDRQWDAVQRDMRRNPPPPPPRL
jgi:hypothetical protein